MAVVNQLNLINNVGEEETYDIETKITPTIKQYFRNQVQLSAMEQVTISTDSNDPTVAEFDGFLIIQNTVTSNNGTTTRHLYINGVDFPSTSVSQYAVQRSEIATIPVRKGDEIYAPVATFIINAYFMYYKARDYSN